MATPSQHTWKHVGRNTMHAHVYRCTACKKTMVAAVRGAYLPTGPCPDPADHTSDMQHIPLSQWPADALSLELERISSPAISRMYMNERAVLMEAARRLREEPK